MSGAYKHQGQVEVLDVTSLDTGLVIVRKRTAEFTHEEAVDLLENIDEFVGDRKLKQNHVDYLVAAMKRGTFHPEWVTVITCKLDEKVFRMNGQHTAWARLELPEDWPCEVSFIEYEAESERDMRTLYSSIDRASPRTRANVIDSYLIDSEEFGNVKRTTLRHAPKGYTLWRWPTASERRKHDGDDTAFLMRGEGYDLSMKVCGFLDRQSPNEHRHIFRAPVIAAMFATFDRAPQISQEFWGPVVDGVGMANRLDPRLKLRNELMNSAVGLGGGANSQKKKVSQELMFRICIVAWNAYRESRDVRVLRASERGRRSRVK